jgi:glycosyltransferase involved in cell wall biosynthesis
MKVLVLDQFSDPGGAQQCLAELLPAMAGREWRGLVAMPGEGELFDCARAAGFETEQLRFGPYQSGRKSLSDLARFIGDAPRLAWRIRALAERVRADLIYVNGPRLLPAVAMANTRRPVVFHSHSFLPRGTVRRTAGAALARMNSRVIAACEFVGEPWRAFLANERVDVIYNGVKGPSRLPARRVGGPPRVGCIGRIAPEKGQREFVAAAARIHQALPECRFAIYGAALFGDERSTRYAADVRRSAEGRPIEFTGWVEDVYSAMAGLDLLLVPSLGNEATTRVVLEAFAAGVPVIAFRSGGIPEVIENGASGVLARDAENMAELAILLLTGDPRRLISISRCARESWERRFHIERYHQDLLRALTAAAGLGVPVGLGR